MRTFSLLIAGAATLVLAACGDSGHTSGTDHGGGSTASVAASAAGTFNDADVTFAQAMVPHHQQAVEMAALADGRVADSEVKELAAKIQAAQQPEIDTMTGWLAAWGRPVSHGSADSGHGAMPGMMSDADMAALKAAEGAEFDKQFLTMMVGHHEGAVEMAQQEVAQGSNADAKALAQKIITDQQAEIATMKAIIDRL